MYDLRDLKALNPDLCSTEEQVFDILRLRDGRKVAIPYEELGAVLGWK